MSVLSCKVMAFSLLTVTLGLSLTAGMQPAQAQAKKTGPKKAAPVKPVAAPGKPIILGTTQLPGDFGKLGTTYTIGNSEPINFTLRSAEYSFRESRTIPGAGFALQRSMRRIKIRTCSRLSSVRERRRA